MSSCPWTVMWFLSLGLSNPARHLFRSMRRRFGEKLYVWIVLTDTAAQADHGGAHGGPE